MLTYKSISELVAYGEVFTNGTNGSQSPLRSITQPTVLILVLLVISLATLAFPLPLVVIVIVIALIASST